MPALTIHLAIAKKYLENHPEEDKESFISGSIAPDFGYDKISNHYGKEFDKITCLEEYVSSMVDYDEYLKYNKLDTSYNRGFFLHLLTDYIFYYDFLNNNHIKGLNLNEIIKIGSKDFNSIASYIIKKYGLEIPDIAKDIIEYSNDKPKILTKEDIASFIEFMANINFSNYKSKLRLKK